MQKETIKQSKSYNWFKLRAGRITASKFKSACATSTEKPSLSLIKGICYPPKMLFKTKQLTYGLDHEEKARNDYQKYMGTTMHINISVTKTGLIIDLKNPIYKIL